MDSEPSPFHVTQTSWNREPTRLRELRLGGTCTPNASYNIDVVLFAKIGEESGFGVNAGFTSGALTSYLASDGYDAKPGGAVTGGNWRIPIGSTSADALGDLHVFLDNDDPEFSPRTEIDGVIYSLVPEPGSLTLFALGALSLLGLRRRSA